MVIARLIQAATLRPDDRVLDVAGGSGYGAALMARLAGKVVALEAEEAQTAAAAAALAAIGETRVETVTGTLDQGFPAGSPYDAIVINGAIEELPEALPKQLREGGCLVAIDKSFGAPKAVRFDRIAGELSRRPLFDAGAPLLPGFQKAPRFVF
jgi:protein-L-isoaspartate(D-aspartate) O-methyltransferase